MSVEIVLQPAPDETLLAARRARLAAVRVELHAREAELVQLRARLRTFETRYLQEVGRLYAELDDVEALTAEREVDLYDSDAARDRAREARQRARETKEAAELEASEPEELEPPPTLKVLFRDVAKRIHPDRARDSAEASHFTRLMTRANGAYRRGDSETLQRLLDDLLDVQGAEAAAGEKEGPERPRLERQIGHAVRDLELLVAEGTALLTSELGALYLEAEAAARAHRDLIAELAAGLRVQIETARRQFALIDRQIEAHGR